MGTFPLVNIKGSLFLTAFIFIQSASHFRHPKFKSTEEDIPKQLILSILQKGRNHSQFPSLKNEVLEKVKEWSITPFRGGV
jgi:hypothetical protein